MNNLNGKTWANVMNEENAKRAVTRKALPKKSASRSPPRRRSMTPNSPNTTNVRRMRSSFKRGYQRNPESYIRSRRRRQGRPSRSSRSPRSSPKRHGLTPEKKNTKQHTAKKHNAKTHNKQEKGPKPRAGKVMRECIRDCTNEGCQRHVDTKDCKFVHKGEPEYDMLRSNQKAKKGGFTMSSPKPLSSVNTYTSWPGGVDPTARLYNQASML
jgi:hypothetical protein